MTTPDSTWDALVVGAGAGGMFAAARLAARGYRVLVVERQDKLGGRASSTLIDGFTVNDGAVGIEIGGIVEETFAEVGAPLDLRLPSAPFLYRVGAKDLDVARGGWGVMLKGVTRQGAKLLTGMGAARGSDDALPGAELSTAEWVARYTSNTTVAGIFHNMCASIFAVGADELPARLFLTYFTRKSAFKRFGFCPQGTIGLWLALAEVIGFHRGEIWLSSEVTALHVADGAVTGVTVRRNGTDVEVGAAVVVSDTGPAATVGLVGAEQLPAEYVAEIEAKNRPASMITINFASRDRLLEAPGLLVFANARRLTYVANYTATCPEMAPPGWHLYGGSSVTRPSVGPFDEEDEIALLRQDLTEQVPGFAAARVLSTVVTRDDWPPARAVAGHDMPRETPLSNLWNVGDGVKEYANSGTSACAETAQLVVDQIVASHPLPIGQR